MQSCFGKYWEGTNDSSCKDGNGCGDYSDCLAQFARGALLHAQQEGSALSGVDALSKKLGVSPGSVLLAINFQNNAGIVPVYAPKPEPVKAESKPGTVIIE